MSTLRLGLHLPNLGEPSQLVDLGVRAEQAGWDGVFLWDHVLGSREMTLPMADPWVVLGALAVRTSRVRLGTAVTPVARRRPQVLARQTVTVDRLSGGRLILGVGLGNPLDAEYAAFGESADPRLVSDRLDEGLQVLAAAWSGEPVRHTGRWFRIERATFAPTPVQRPRVPVWVACTWPHRRPLLRAARWDGVVAARMGPDGGLEVLTVEDVASLTRDVHAERADPAPFDVVVVNPGLPGPAADDYAAAGATCWLPAGWLDEIPDLIARARRADSARTTAPASGSPGRG